MTAINDGQPATRSPHSQARSTTQNAKPNASNAVSNPTYVASRSGTVEKLVMPCSAKFHRRQTPNLLRPPARGAR